MPIFEYKCAACGHTMEVLHKSHSAAKPACEQCGSKDVQKLISGFAVAQGKSSSPAACESCPSGPCDSAACQGGVCPMS